MEGRGQFNTNSANRVFPTPKGLGRCWFIKFLGDRELFSATSPLIPCTANCLNRKFWLSSESLPSGNLFIMRNEQPPPAILLRRHRKIKGSLCLRNAYYISRCKWNTFHYHLGINKSINFLKPLLFRLTQESWRVTLIFSGT